MEIYLQTVRRKRPVLNKISAFLLLMLIAASPVYSREYKISTWNLSFLYDESGDENKFPKNRYKRTENDFLRLKSRFTQISPDIASFQEVENLNAVYKIIPSGQYNCTITLNNSSNQEIAACWKKELPGPKISHFKSLQINNMLRPALVTDFELNGKLTRIVHIHLKAGNPQGIKGRSVDIRKKQFFALGSILKGHKSFIVLGDYNYDLKKDPASIKGFLPEIIIAGKDTRPACWQYKKFFIDYIASSTDIQFGRFQQHRYPEDDGRFDGKPYGEKGLSDHCPVSVTFR